MWRRSLVLSCFQKKQGKSERENQHCVKSVQIRSFSGPYFPVLALSEDQEKTPYLDTSRGAGEQPV